MSWLSDNLGTALLVLGFALLVVEVAVFGFSVFVLLFIGLGCLVTGALIGVGLLPASMTVAFILVAILSGVFAFALWQPLKRMQNSGGTINDVSNDLLGHSFLLKHAVSPIHMIHHRYSGVDWKVKALTDIPAGTMVEVIKVEVGELTVAAK